MVSVLLDFWETIVSKCTHRSQFTAYVWFISELFGAKGQIIHFLTLGRAMNRLLATGCRGGANWRRHHNIGENDIIFGHINIQSLKPKLIDIRHDICKVYGFDILALCETLLSPNVPDRLINIDGYKLFRRDRPRSMNLPRGRGCVAVLVRDNLNFELLADNLSCEH